MDLPNADDQINDLLDRVDKSLAAKGVPISARPMQALGEISAQFNVSLPISPPLPGMRHPVFDNWTFSEKVLQWYDGRYGDRLKVEFGPGRIAFLLRGDPWVFRFPRIFGKVVFFAIRAPRSQQTNRFSMDGTPVGHNIVDSIEALPEGFRSSLTDTELNLIENRFMLGFTALMLLEELAPKNELATLAKSEIAASVDHIMGHQPELSLSKWASLHAAEKALKAAIQIRGGPYTRTHKLDVLCQEARNAGFNLDIDSQINQLSCGAGIRYGQERATLEEAVSAHHATLEIVLNVAKQIVV